MLQHVQLDRQFSMVVLMLTAFFVQHSTVVAQQHDAEIVAFINGQIRAGWDAHQLRPSAPATDAEWCRRACLDLLGRSPSEEESAAFVANLSGTKKLDLINELMGESPRGTNNDRYGEEFAKNWATIFANLLNGRPCAKGYYILANREGLISYLQQSLMENKPYDQFVTELITANGAVDPQAKNFNGAANYLVDKLRRDGAEATGWTARYFLGMHLQCIQCHNQAWGDLKTDMFWSLNAFFRQAKVEAERGTLPRFDRLARVYDADYPGQGGGDIRNAELFYELRNGTQAVAYPKFIDGTKIDASGRLGDVNRRVELAKLIIRSERFPKAVVNRLWSYFLGHGFTRRIDDLEYPITSSHPELLDRLAEEFSKSQYDLKQLMRWIMLSQAYSLSSQVTDAQQETGQADNAIPWFNRFCLHLAIVDQHIGQVEVVPPRKNAPEPDWERMLIVRKCVLAPFTQWIESDNSSRPVAYYAIVSKKCISVEEQAALTRFLADPKSGLSLVRDLFVNAFGRGPTADEIVRLKQALSKAVDEPICRDLLDSLDNIGEFTWVE